MKKFIFLIPFLLSACGPGDSSPPADGTTEEAPQDSERELYCDARLAATAQSKCDGTNQANDLMLYFENTKPRVFPAVRFENPTFLKRFQEVGADPTCWKSTICSMMTTEEVKNANN